MTAILSARIDAKDAVLDGVPRPVLRDIRLDVQPGEVVALRGPSGAGKTTLLRLLAGLDLAFSGSVTRAAGVKLGMVFQEPRLLPWRTLAQNFALVRPAPGAASDPAAIAARLGLDGFLHAYPRQLSLGMARRAAVARALCVRPGLLLLDEPFASLDDASAAAVRTAIRDFWRAERCAVVLVTHDAADAAALASRSVTLTGSPATLTP